MRKFIVKLSYEIEVEEDDCIDIGMPIENYAVERAIEEAEINRVLEYEVEEI